MRPSWDARHERVSARDAAMRRIAWWTAALAVGSVAGTAGVAGAAQVAAHPASVDVPVTIADTSAVAATGDDPAAAPTSSASTASRSASTRRATAGASGTRNSRRATSAPRRTARVVSKPDVQAQAPRPQAPKPPVVATSGS